MGSIGRQVDGKEVIEKFYGGKGKWSDIKPKYALRNCPVCGATQADNKVLLGYFGFNSVDDGWVAYCMNCHHRTKFYRKEIDAAGEWNERT